MIANAIGELRHRIVVCTVIYVIFEIADFRIHNTDGKPATWPCKVPCFLCPTAIPLGRIPNPIGKAKPHVAKDTCSVGPFATRARGGCQGRLEEAPGLAGGRPEAAGRADFDPYGEIRGV